MKIYKVAQNRSVTVQSQGLENGPIIMLRGKWLLQAGFYPKDILNVEVSENRIVLSVSKQADEETRDYYRKLWIDKPIMNRTQGTPINIPKV